MTKPGDPRQVSKEFFVCGSRAAPPRFAWRAPRRAAASRQQGLTTLGKEFYQTILRILIYNLLNLKSRYLTNDIRLPRFSEKRKRAARSLLVTELLTLLSKRENGKRITSVKCGAHERRRALIHGHSNVDGRCASTILRHYALLEEQVRRARSDDGRL